MIEIYENSWRPFIVLHNTEDCEVYFDVTKRPTLIQYEDGTELYFNMEDSIIVKETAKDIIAAVDKMIKIEADKKAAQWEANMAETMARVEANKEKFGDK